MGRRKKLPTVLNEEEQKNLLEIFNERYATALRNKAIVKLILDTGLRLSETTNLKWEHINMMSGKIFIEEGKGAKDRLVWASEMAIELLRTWRERQAEELNRRGYKHPYKHVFTTLTANQMNNRNLRRMINKYSKKAGIKKNVSPHTLRHTFATDFYRGTNDIRATQKALGHSDLSTTMIYTHIVDDDLENKMKNFRDGFQ